MLSFFNQNEIEKIVSFAFEAGKIAVKDFETKNFSIEKKLDNSQVTSTDIAVSKFLHEKLSQQFPQIPLICEERDLRRISSEIFFLIDPIDGTSSFVSSSVEFAVNIALVRNKKAVFGLIYAPLFEGGKMIFSNHQNQIVSRNLFGEQKILNAANNIDQTKLNIITSPRSKDLQLENFISQICPNFLQNFSVERLSSAIKFFRLLEGKSNIYLHFRPSMEWDTAAGQALVELMGGKVKNLFFNQNQFLIGENLSYKKPDFLNTAFLASF